MVRMLAVLVGLFIFAPCRADDGGRLVHEGIVDAPVEKVWAAFTTSKGLRAWMVPHAEIELKVGGLMRTNYQPDGKLGDENTIENTIISYDPMKMLSIKATKPPANFPFKNEIKGMWSVMYLEKLGDDKTKLITVGLGYTDSPESQQMRQFFNAGNEFTIRKLQEYFKDG